MGPVSENEFNAIRSQLLELATVIELEVDRVILRAYVDSSDAAFHDYAALLSDSPWPSPELASALGAHLRDTPIGRKWTLLEDVLDAFKHPDPVGLTTKGKNVAKTRNFLAHSLSQSIDDDGNSRTDGPVDPLRRRFSSFQRTKREHVYELHELRLVALDAVEFVHSLQDFQAARMQRPDNL